MSPMRLGERSHIRVVEGRSGEQRSGLILENESRGSCSGSSPEHRGAEGSKAKDLDFGQVNFEFL